MTDHDTTRPSHRHGDSEYRVPRLFWWVLGGLYVVAAGVASDAAPCGRWVNRVFGFDMWLESDPGAWYMAASHEVFGGATPVYAGHPGIPLQLLLYAVQRVCFWIWGTDGTGFTEVTARHIHHVFLVSKVLMSALHAVSIYALFRFSRVLLRHDRPALFAALGYATCLPVLYFLSRVSVEPLMVLFFLGTWLSLWAYEGVERGGAAGTGRPPRGEAAKGAAFAALAGAAAVSGAFTKMHLLAPLPLFAFLYLFLGSRLSWREPESAWRARVVGLAAFLSSSAACFWLYSRLVSWPHFFDYWSQVVRGRSSDASPLIAETLRDATGGLLGRLSWEAVLPGATKSGLFLLCELPFLLVAGAGVVLHAVRRPGEGARLLWVVLVAGYTVVVWGYRSARGSEFSGFHYLFVAMVVLSVFFGSALESVRPQAASTFRGSLAAALVSVALVHQTAVWAVVGSRLADARAYAPIRPYFEALARLPPGGRVGILTDGDRDLDRRVRAVTDTHAPEGVRSSLREELDRLSVRIVDRGQPTSRLVARMRAADVRLVFDTVRPSTPPAAPSLEEWAATVER